MFLITRPEAHLTAKTTSPSDGQIAVLFVSLVLAASAVGILTARAVVVGWHGPVGQDLDLYLGFTRSWLAGNGWYLPQQLAGPYVVEAINGNMYPPVLLYLTVPFALGLPVVLWWMIPVGIVAFTFWRVRPAPWAWCVVAFAFVYARTWTLIISGNPSMWALAFAVAGTAWGWPAVGTALKLTLAPLALIGIRRRSWWVALAAAVTTALPFGPLWLDYITALGNATSERGFGYLMGEWPIALALVTAAASAGRPLSNVGTRAGGARWCVAAIANGPNGLPHPSTFGYRRRLILTLRLAARALIGRGALIAGSGYRRSTIAARSKPID
jgi:hypothetical protein